MSITNFTTAVFLINDHVRSIKASYEGAGPEEMFKTFDTTIVKDDILVVPSGTRHKFTTVKVTEVDVEVDFHSTAQVRWVAAKVDMVDFEKMLAQEQEALTKIRSAQIRKERDDLRKALLVDNDETIKALPISTKQD